MRLIRAILCCCLFVTICAHCHVRQAWAYASSPPSYWDLTTAGALQNMPVMSPIGNCGVSCGCATNIFSVGSVSVLVGFSYATWLSCFDTPDKKVCMMGCACNKSSLQCYDFCAPLSRSYKAWYPFVPQHGSSVSYAYYVPSFANFSPTSLSSLKHTAAQSGSSRTSLIMNWIDSYNGPSYDACMSGCSHRGACIVPSQSPSVSPTISTSPSQSASTTSSPSSSRNAAASVSASASTSTSSLAADDTNEACASNPCQDSDDSCVALGTDSFYCDCSEGYVGTFCQAKIQSALSLPDAGGGDAGGTASHCPGCLDLFLEFRSTNRSTFPLGTASEFALLMPQLVAQGMPDSLKTRSDRANTVLSTRFSVVQSSLEQCATDDEACKRNVATEIVVYSANHPLAPTAAELRKAVERNVTRDQWFMLTVAGSKDVNDPPVLFLDTRPASIPAKHRSEDSFPWLFVGLGIGALLLVLGGAFAFRRYMNKKYHTNEDVKFLGLEEDPTAEAGRVTITAAGTVVVHNTDATSKAPDNNTREAPQPARPSTVNNSM